MTDVDRMTETDAEVRLRASLHASLVPPATPASLRAAVDRMAVAHATSIASTRPTFGQVLGMGARGLRFALGTVALLAVAAVALVVLGARDDHPRVGTTPPPTLPAITGPALPSAPAAPTRLAAATWIDGDTIWAQPLGTATFRMSTDGGQTWSDARSFARQDADLVPTFVDADHGYSSWIEGAQGAERSLVVYLTDDGGRTWSTTTAGSLPAVRNTSAASSVRFSDPDHGLALATLRMDVRLGADWGPAVACDGFATDDGGRTWAPIDEAPCIAGPGYWASATHGVLTLADGRLATTTDGGRHWVAASLPARPSGAELWLRSAVVTDTGVLRLAGVDFIDGGALPFPLVVLESADGGATWRDAYRSDSIDMGRSRAMTAFDADHWLATVSADTADPMLDGSRFLETWDAGRTWASAGQTPIDTGGGVSWADRLHGTIQGDWMVRNPDGSGEGYITVWITNDGGATWHEVAF